MRHAAVLAVCELGDLCEQKIRQHASAWHPLGDFNDYRDSLRAKVSSSCKGRDANPTGSALGGVSLAKGTIREAKSKIKKKSSELPSWFFLTAFKYIIVPSKTLSRTSRDTEGAAVCREAHTLPTQARQIKGAVGRHAPRFNLLVTRHNDGLCTPRPSRRTCRGRRPRGGPRPCC